MKTFKFLAALALPAMFAACTSEDLTIETPMQNQEIVGAELVGTDIAISVEKGGVDSRYANGDWELTDLIGMGWVTKTDGFYPQASNREPDNATLYANNMFSIEDGAFRTKGNIYKGWHFAYYPYARMEKLGEKDINLNPDQVCEWVFDGGDRYKDYFALSAKHFLDETDVDPVTNKLSDEKSFKTYFIANEIPVQLIPNEDFVSSKYLNNLTIKSIGLNAGRSKNVFKYEGKLKANLIPSAVDKDGKSIYTSTAGEYDETKTKAALFAKVPEIFDLTATNSIETNLETVGLTTGANGFTRFFTLPYKYASPTAADITIIPTITIEVEGGVFTIAKDAKAEAGSLADLNNKELDKLIAAYKQGGDMTKDEAFVALSLNLYPAIFEPDFDHIKTLKEWTNCVNVAKALGMEGPLDFTLENDIEFTGTSIPLPNVQVNVLGGKKMIIKKTLSKGWPAADKLNVEATNVVFDAPNTLTQAIAANNIVNNSNLTIAAGTDNVNGMNNVTVNENNGTIIVNKFAKVSDVDNNDGRIQIIYGGIAEATVSGVIYYEVQKNEKAARINNLVEDGLINTLVVKSGITFDLNTVDPITTTGDEYGYSSTVPECIDPTNLSEITIEMAGGIVEGNLETLKVAAIDVVSGTSNKTIDLIAGAITVNAGTLTLDATTPSTPADAEKNVLDMKTTNVIVEAGATLIANANTHVNDLNNAGTVKANAGYLFHYYSGENNGTLTGEVEKCDHPTDAELELAADQEKMQILVNEMNPKPNNYNDLATQLKNYAQLDNVTNNPGYKAVQFAELMNEYFQKNGMDFEYTDEYYTEANIKLFEIFIGKKIQF